MSQVETNAASLQDINGTQPLPARLNPAQVETYRREGYLIVPEPVLPDATFARLCRTFEAILADLPEDKRPEDLDVPHLVHPELFEFLFHPSVLSLVTPLLGNDVALFSSHFICKPAADGKRVPWHQDSFYWRHLLSPMEVVTVWLAIDPSDDGNGAMRVIPRTHTNGDVGYEDADLTINTFPKEISRRHLDEAEGRAVTCTLLPNHASLHDAVLFHGSEANRSARRRCGYTMRFISAATKYNMEAGNYHQIYLANGQDRAGNRYGDPSVPRPDLIEARAHRIRRGH